MALTYFQSLYSSLFLHCPFTIICMVWHSHLKWVLLIRPERVWLMGSNRLTCYLGLLLQPAQSIACNLIWKPGWTCWTIKIVIMSLVTKTGSIKQYALSYRRQWLLWVSFSKHNVPFVLKGIFTTLCKSPGLKTCCLWGLLSFLSIVVTSLLTFFSETCCTRKWVLQSLWRISICTRPNED
jgi:hypothetical protein